MKSQTMVVTDYYKGRTIGNIQKEGTMEFPTRWLCCTGKRSYESRSCDHISTYRSRKKEKCGPSAQECNIKGAVVIANKDVEHHVTRSTCHAFDNLIRDGQDSRVADGDGIEQLKVMDKAKGTALFVDTKPA